MITNESVSSYVDGPVQCAVERGVSEDLFMIDGFFDPLKFGAANVEFDASDESTIALSVMDTILTITDKIAGETVSNSLITDRPDTGTRVLNGKNVLEFDGSDQLIGTFSSSQPNSWVVVFKLDAVGGTAQNIFDSNNASARQSFGVTGGGSPEYFLHAGSTDMVDGEDTNAHVAICYFNGASSALYVDSEIGTPLNPGTQNATGLTFGARHDGANGMNGFFARS